MLNIENLEKFTKQAQTSLENVVREYCEHLFLSYLYKESGSEKLLFKGGTALRIVFRSPRYSEDLDFTGSNITQREIEEIFANTLVNIEQTGIHVDLSEGKSTSGGYLGRALFHLYNLKIPVQIEISLRHGKDYQGTTTLIENDYVTAYSLVHLSKEKIVQGKIQALLSRHKPRDFYDYYFLLSGNYPMVKEKTTLQTVLKLLNDSDINFSSELKRFLPAGHSMHLRNFKKILQDKISSYLD